MHKEIPGRKIEKFVEKILNLASEQGISTYELKEAADLLLQKGELQ